jgi:SAM-dependent methyltransferase
MSRFDVWEAGDAYERYVGRWSRRIAPEFLDWLEVPAKRTWLDLGCGTGAITEAIISRCDPDCVVGADASRPFVEHASTLVADTRASFTVADAAGLPFDDHEFDAAVSGLLLNFLPEPSAALAELRRVVVAGGMVGAYVWDYQDGMEVMRRFWDAAVAVEPEARELHESLRFPLTRPGALERVFLLAGLESISIRAIETPARFADFDDYWSPFLGGQGPAPSYTMSLSEDRRAALRERLRATLPTQPDGSIQLLARAWAVRGRH